MAVNSVILRKKRKYLFQCPVCASSWVEIGPWMSRCENCGTRTYAKGDNVND